ncbi:MAG: sulfatase-like hydrolase/transferase [Eggerthellaceae bacterium]|nr:sulfatase-like hydrolase/transferase [Eggerthellaceae bacterium]
MSSKYSAKRLVVVAYDTVTLLIVCLLLNMGMPKVAYAYVDPSVMTYTIQALAGVAVALSAVAGVAFRRSRRALFRILKIDENANKEVEQDVCRVESRQSNLTKEASALLPEGAQVLATDGAPSKQSSSRTAKKIAWPKRFLLALVVTLFCSFTLFIVAPFEIVAGASGDLAFGIEDIWRQIGLFALGVTLVGAILVSLFRGKAFTPVLALVFAFGLCCYIQAMFLNNGLPSADGRTVDWWGDYGVQIMVSAVVWIVVVAAIVVVACLKQRPTRFFVAVLSVVLVFVQGVGVASLFADRASAADNPKGPSVLTETGLFQVSEKNNVVVFILDFYDTQTLINMVEQNPGMLDEMEGFTWYQNSAGVMIPTGFALPYLMTAQTPAVDQSIDDFLVERWTKGEFLEDLHDSGYSVGVYTTTFGLEYLTNEQIDEEIYSNLDNAHPQGLLHIYDNGAVKMLVKMALYRDMPWLFKWRFLFYTDDVNQSVVYTEEEQMPDETIYIMDDARFFRRLNSFGLSLERGDYNGAFRMIHLNGDHFPFTIDEHGELVGEENSSKEKQAVGSMLMVSTYIQYMKDLGVYDDATIIITADHGDWVPTMDLPDMATSPIMLVKEPHAGAEQVKISHAPVSHEDLFKTVLEAMGQEALGYPNTTFDSFDEGDERLRYFYYITHDQSATIHSLLGYEIDGDVNDFANWTFTGDVWDCYFFNH